MVKKHITRGLTLLLMAVSLSGAFAEMPDIIAPEEELLSTDEVADTLLTVTFMDAWGAVLFQEKVSPGQTLSPPMVEPEREGYAFLYWYDLGPSAMEPYPFGQAVESDLVLWPNFERNSVFPEEPPEPDGEPAEQESGKAVEEPGEASVVYEDVSVLVDDGAEQAMDGSPQAPMICVTSSQEGAAAEGERITLTAELIGIEPGDVHLQWQYATADAPDVWMDVPGAASVVYAFGATEETVGRLWRLVATMK